MADPAFEPDPVSSDTAPNFPNQKNFFDKLQKDTRRIDALERKSIRSGAVGGAGFRFYEKGSPDDTLTRVGQFLGSFWTVNPVTGGGEWTPLGQFYGFAGYQKGQQYPFFAAGTDGAKQFVQAGYVAGQPLESVMFKTNDMWLQSTGGSYIHQNSDGDILMKPESGRALGLYNIPTIGASSLQLVFDFSGSYPQVKYISSALKYKRDIEDAVVDVEDVLQMQGRTWRDKSAVEEDPDTTQRFVGFIADELMMLPTCRQFVSFDKEGEPQSIYYDRLSVALLEAFKSTHAKNLDQDERIAECEMLIKTQKETIDQLSTRLANIESMVESNHDVL